MNKEYGGKKPIMHDSYIPMEEGYLGPHQRKVNVGMNQVMVFKEDDDGPFYLNQEDRESRRHDKEMDEDRVVKKTKRELVDELKATGIMDPKGSTKHLQKLCQDNNISIQKTVKKKIEGWVGKPKGMLQILWERGWIDVEKLAYYTTKGRRDSYGVLDQEYSLEHLLSNCHDFLQEESMLQYIAKKIGVSIDHTPVYHAEIAGEGQELNWALAKVKYRHSLISEKRTKESFRNLVKECISRKWITIERARHNARRTRCYIVAYTNLHFGNMPKESVDEPVPVIIEKLVKKYKSHRSSLDIDSAYVNYLIDLSKEE